MTQPSDYADDARDAAHEIERLRALPRLRKIMEREAEIARLQSIIDDLKRALKARARPDDDEVDAFSIATFCRRNNISKPFYFKLRAKGLAPAEMRLGTRVLITKEAAEKWRRDRGRASKRSSSCGERS